VDPIKEVVSQSEQLVKGYRNIVDRTRTFVNNMKALRELGLDPTLFNQLVEAGVDAGGATAEALIEGGSDTVTEVNSLFGELNRLGQELGEETAQVMYGQGELFVDGIVNGLEAQAEELEKQAVVLADSFTETFREMLISGIELAIAQAEAALARMPVFEPFEFGPPPGPPGPDPDPNLDPDSVPLSTSEMISRMVEDRRRSAQIASDLAARARMERMTRAAALSAAQARAGRASTGEPPNQARFSQQAQRNQAGQTFVIQANSPATARSAATTIKSYVSSSSNGYANKRTSEIMRSGPLT